MEVSESACEHCDGLYVPCGVTGVEELPVFCKDHNLPEFSGRIKPYLGRWVLEIGTDEKLHAPLGTFGIPPQKGWLGVHNTTATFAVDCSGIFPLSIGLNGVEASSALQQETALLPQGDVELAEVGQVTPYQALTPAMEGNFVKAIAATTQLAESQIQVTRVEGGTVHFTLDLSSTPTSTVSSLSKLQEASEDYRLRNWLNNFGIEAASTTFHSVVPTDVGMSPSPSPAPVHAPLPSPVGVLPPREGASRDEYGCLPGSKWCELFQSCIDSRSPCVARTEVSSDCNDKLDEAAADRLLEEQRNDVRLVAGR